MNEFICRSGVPSQLHSDQGTNFESKVFVEVCRLLDIEKPGVTPLHPQSDGQVERPPPPPEGEAFQQDSHLSRGKIQQDLADWDTQLAACMIAYV